MRKLLVSAALLASTLMASPAMAVDFSSDLATWQALNPGYTEDTTYGTHFTTISSLTLDDGTQLALTPSTTIYGIGDGWATWCCGYTGDVLNPSGTSLTIDLLTGVDAFGFFAEPNPFAEYLITLGLTDGSSLTQLVKGDSGAKFFGYSGGGVSTMTVSSSVNFAVGDFMVKAAVPEPATWGMMLLGFGAMGMAFRRNRKTKPIAQLA